MPRLGSRVRVSFSAQNGKDSFRLSFFILHCRKRRLAQSNPKTPLSGVGGVNISSRELSARSAGSSLVFRSKWKRQLQAVFFHFALSEMMARTERPHSPLPGVGGVNISSRESARAQDEGRTVDRRPWIVFRLRPKVTGQNQAQYGKITLSTKAAYPIKLAGGFRDVIYSKIYTGVSLYLSKAR